MTYPPIPQIISSQKVGERLQPAESLVGHTLQDNPHPIYTRKVCSPKALTIASGAVTIYPSIRYYTLRGEDGTADSLTTINGGRDGYCAVFRAVADDVTITLANSSGNILLNGGTNFALDSYYDTVQLMYDSALSKWLEIGRGNNA